MSADDRTFSDEWAAAFPRPEWDKPGYWEAARPVFPEPVDADESND